MKENFDNITYFHVLVNEGNLRGKSVKTLESDQTY